MTATDSSEAEPDSGRSSAGCPRARVRPVHSTQTLGLVSHGLPPGSDGFSIMLRELLGAVAQERLALVGLGGQPWGERTRVRLPVLRIPSGRSESAVAALALIAARAAAGPILRRLFPNVRRIIATLDPTLGIAGRWASATGADLWLYAIDLHATSFWGGGSVLQTTLAAWRREAFARASRIFAISPKMADWLRADGATGEIEVLPPLIDVGLAGPAPLPPGRPSFLFCGWVYSAQGRALSWVERAVAEIAPDTELRLLTLMSRPELARAGLDLRRWTVASATAEEVVREVARSTCSIVALDPGVSDPGARASLQVAFPTKLREYLSVGRPVLCVAPPDYGIAQMATEGGWGIVASDEASTREAVRRICQSSPDQLAALSRAAYDFARTHLDNRVVGARFREQALTT
jgi:hypothetical protein